MKSDPVVVEVACFFSTIDSIKCLLFVEVRNYWNILETVYLESLMARWGLGNLTTPILSDTAFRVPRLSKLASDYGLA